MDIYIQNVVTFQDTRTVLKRVVSHLTQDTYVQDHGTHLQWFGI